MKKPPQGSQCHYCGMIATGYDHVIPLVIAQQIGHLDVIEELTERRILLVPCCKECNSLLSDSFQEGLAERKVELKRRLRRRYKKILKMPRWDLEMMDEGEMGRMILDFIQHGMKLKEIIRTRLNW